MKKSLLFLFLLLVSFPLFAQNAEEANPDLDLNAEYTPPTEPDVQAKLEQWQNLKFGMLIHWGLYAVPGIVESWSICSEDEDWIPRDSTMRYDEYKRWYWSLNKMFNPRQFDPDQWATAARKAGMRYVVFTTKHHDGFAMYDTKYSNYSIAKGPFADHPKADVAKYVFDAFRKQHFMVGAYFSKPDWHSQDYWWDRYATPDRHVNYKIENHPYRWERYKNFVYNQINEITANYGPLDILWLDGGWVREPDEDINMDRIVTKARQNQPGLLVVDRTVTGKYENYRTPEKMVPERQLAYPWETCVPLSKDWGYVPGAEFKTTQQIINMLVEVVAKGGSLLLGVGPTPEGVIEPAVVERLEQIGQWLQANGSAIYGTRPVLIYNEGNVWFTVSKDKTVRYAIVTVDADHPIGSTVTWRTNLPSKRTEIKLLSTGEKLKYKIQKGQVTVSLPKYASNTALPVAIEYW
ncbi:MAG: alpha-L-fucosidase [Bacteroidales bacterium]|nr:alpha-L-fucosidase [Bacteroidales bacterium]